MNVPRRLWTALVSIFNPTFAVSPWWRVWRVRRVTRQHVVLRSDSRIGPTTYDTYGWHGRVVVIGARTPAEALRWAAQARQRDDANVR